MAGSLELSARRAHELTAKRQLLSASTLFAKSCRGVTGVLLGIRVVSPLGTLASSGRDSPRGPSGKELSWRKAGPWGAAC